MTGPKPAQSFPAGTFVCDACGVRVFFAMPCLDPAQLSDAVKAQISATSGVSPGVPSFLFQFPRTVACQACQAVYAPYESPDELLDILDRT